MPFNKKGLLLAGLAAYAYYRYTRMPKEERENLVNGIKEKGRDIWDKYVPGSVKDMMSKKEGEAGSPNAEAAPAYHF